MARTIAIEVVVDDKGAVTGIRGIDGQIKKLERSTDRASKSGFDLGQAFSFAVGGLMVGAAAAAGKAIRGLVSEGRKLTGLSAEIFETQNKVNSVFGDATPVVEKYIDQYAALSGMSRTAAKELTATTGAILQGAGFAERASADMSVAVARLAADLTSFTNVPIEDTFRAINAGLVGEREQLKRFGIVVRESDVQQKALIQTGKERADQLTQAEKAQASYNLILEKAAFAHGDLARTQDSAANQTRQIQARIQDLRETLALELLPAVELVVTELNNFISDPDLQADAKALGEAIRDTLLIAIEAIKSTINFLRNYQDEAKEAVKVIAVMTSAQLAYKAATKGAAIAQQALNVATAANPWGALAKIILSVVAAFGAWEVIQRRINNLIEDATSKVEDNRSALAGWTEDALKARLIFLGLQLDEARAERNLARVMGIQSAEFKRAAARVLEIQQMIGETRVALNDLVRSNEPEPGSGGDDEGGGDTGPAPDRPAPDRAAVPIGGKRTELEERLRLNAEILDAEMELDTMIRQLEQARTEEEKAAIRERIKAREEERQKREEAIEAIVSADFRQIKSVRDAANAVVDSVRRVIKARIAEAVATVAAKSAITIPFPINIAVATAGGIAIEKALEGVIPRFARGVKNFSGGPAIVGEQGPELVNLPRGSDVISAPETSDILSRRVRFEGGDFRLRGEDIWGSWHVVDRRMDREGRK